MLTRRSLLARSGPALVAASLALPARRLFAGDAAPAIVLPPLPYPDNALEPVLSAKTISFHHGKHHKAYVDNVNKLVAGTDLATRKLEDLVQAAAGKPETAALFNNAAQVFNHTFYWNSMKPGGGGKPVGKIAAAIE
jgi:superoxide dismutase, Fe-Mn family